MAIQISRFFSAPIKYVKDQYNPIILSRVIEYTKVIFHIKPILLHMMRMQKLNFLLQKKSKLLLEGGSL